jgi:hypothetical protein
MSIILKTCEEKVSGLQMGAPPHFETESRPKSHFRHANLSTFGQVHAETRPTGKQRVRVQGLCKINCEMNNDSTDAEIRAPSNWDMHGCVSMFMPRMHSTCARYTAGPAESQRKGSSEMRRWRKKAVRIREGRGVNRVMEWLIAVQIKEVSRGLPLTTQTNMINELS